MLCPTHRIPDRLNLEEPRRTWKNLEEPGRTWKNLEEPGRTRRTEPGKP
jgi:hypothetical protein